MTGTLKLSSQTDPEQTLHSVGEEVRRREGRWMRGGEQIGRRGKVNRRGGGKEERKGGEEGEKNVRREEG